MQGGKESIDDDVPDDLPDIVQVKLGINHLTLYSMGDFTDP